MSYKLIKNILNKNLANYANANEEFCTIEEFQNCLKLLQSVGSGESDLALPVNEDELESACM